MKIRKNERWGKTRPWDKEGRQRREQGRKRTRTSSKSGQDRKNMARLWIWRTCDRCRIQCTGSHRDHARQMKRLRRCQSTNSISHFRQASCWSPPYQWHTHDGCWIQCTGFHRDQARQMSGLGRHSLYCQSTNSISHFRQASCCCPPYQWHTRSGRRIQCTGSHRDQARQMT